MSERKGIQSLVDELRELKTLINNVGQENLTFEQRQAIEDVVHTLSRQQVTRTKTPSRSVSKTDVLGFIGELLSTSSLQKPKDEKVVNVIGKPIINIGRAKKPIVNISEGHYEEIE